jgi:hypothetical protein
MPVAQGAEQAPQFLGSAVMSTHCPSHLVCPLEQSPVSPPDEQEVKPDSTSAKPRQKEQEVSNDLITASLA